MLQINLKEDLLTIIERDFNGLFSGEVGVSSISGGQTAANLALANLDITGYANNRSQVLPKNRRGATVLSPYIRHNILTLGQVYRAVKTAPFKDREKFRDELFGRSMRATSTLALAHDFLKICVSKSTQTCLATDGTEKCFASTRLLPN